MLGNVARPVTTGLGTTFGGAASAVTGQRWRSCVIAGLAERSIMNGIAWHTPPARARLGTARQDARLPSEEEPSDQVRRNRGRRRRRRRHRQPARHLDRAPKAAHRRDRSPDDAGLRQHRDDAQLTHAPASESPFGITDLATRHVLLTDSVCQNLRAWLTDRPLTMAQVNALVTPFHEADHAWDVKSESAAECHGVTMALIEFGGSDREAAERAYWPVRDYLLVSEGKLRPPPTSCTAAVRTPPSPQTRPGSGLFRECRTTVTRSREKSRNLRFTVGGNGALLSVDHRTCLAEGLVRLCIP